MNKKVLSLILAASMMFGVMATGCSKDPAGSSTGAGSTSTGSSSAEEKIDYPTRQIEITIGYATGTSVDMYARALADELSARWDVPVVITNKTGTSSVAVTKEFVTTAKDDGYNVSIVNAGDTVLHMAINKTPQYQMEDFTFVCRATKHPMCFTVKADAPWNNFKEFSDWAAENSDQLTFCSSSLTAAGAFTIAEWLTAVGGDFSKARIVPISGGSDAAVKIAGGNATMVAGAFTGVQSLVDAGELKTLACSPYPLENRPEIPTAEEAGVTGLTFGNWNAIVMPDGVDEEIVAMWNEAVEEITADKAFAEKVAGMGLFVDYFNGTEFTAQLIEEGGKYKTMAADLGLVK